MSDDRTPMQRALDKDVQIEELAKRVADLEAALKTARRQRDDMTAAYNAEMRAKRPADVARAALSGKDRT